MAVRQDVGFQRTQQGASLIEQIMVIAILGTLTGIAVPSLRQLLTRNQQQTAQTDFIAALQHARETAINSGKNALFCPTRDGNRCSGDTRWDSGWLLGQDSNNDGQPDHGPLYVGPGYTGKLTIQNSAGRHFVRFRPDGSASGSNLTLLFCQQGSTDHVLSVVVSNPGRIRGAPASAQQAMDCAHPN